MLIGLECDSIKNIKDEDSIFTSKKSQRYHQLNPRLWNPKGYNSLIQQSSGSWTSMHIKIEIKNRRLHIHDQNWFMIPISRYYHFVYDIFDLFYIWLRYQLFFVAFFITPLFSWVRSRIYLWFWMSYWYYECFILLVSLYFWQILLRCHSLIHCKESSKPFNQLP